MNRKYADKLEETDYKLLQDFNSTLKLSELGQTPQYHHTDASGYTTDGREVNIELKKRDFNTDTFNTLYIEAHKCGDLLLDYITEDKIPLYVNFCNDGVILFNLSKLKHRPKTFKTKFYSELYKTMELSTREELDIKDAWVYKLQENNTYKLVHRGK